MNPRATCDMLRAERSVGGRATYDVRTCGTCGVLECYGDWHLHSARAPIAADDFDLRLPTHDWTI